MKKLLSGIFLLLLVGTLLMFQHVFNLSKKADAVVTTLKIGGTGGTGQLFDFLRVNKSLGVGYDAPATAGNAIFSGNVGIGMTAPLLPLDVAGSSRFTGKATSVLTGSIDPTASTTVVGVGTLFLTELVPGDRITVTGVTKTVTAIASDTSLTVDTAFTDLANDTSPDKLPAIFVARDTSNVIKMAINNSGTTDVTALSLGGTAVTATATELNYVSGVTSALQTQLGLKAALASPTFTGTVTVPAPVAAGAAVTKSYVDAAGGLTLILTSCGWITSGSPPAVGTCTPTACPTGYTDKGITGCIVNTLVAAPGSTLYDVYGRLSAYYDYWYHNTGYYSTNVNSGAGGYCTRACTL